MNYRHLRALKTFDRSSFDNVQILLTMFFQESITFDLVGFMLSFLFEPASSGCQFVLFFPTFTSCSKRHFTNRCHVVYDAAQLLQFFSDRCQFSWISGKIVSIPTPCLSTVKLEQFINSIPCRTNRYQCNTF